MLIQVDGHWIRPEVVDYVKVGWVDAPDASIVRVKHGCEEIIVKGATNLEEAQQLRDSIAEIVNAALYREGKRL